MNNLYRISRFVFVALVLASLIFVSSQNLSAQDTPKPDAATPAPTASAATVPVLTAPAATDGANVSASTPAATPEAKPAESKSAEPESAEQKPVGADSGGNNNSNGDEKDAKDANAAGLQTQESVAEPPTPFHRTGAFTLIICFILIAGSFWLGNQIAKRSRLTDHGTKIAVVLLAFFGSFAALGLGWHRMTLGIDLQGGVVLVYDAKPIQRGGDAAAQQQQQGRGTGDGVASGLDMDKLTRAITKRINPGGVREIAITKLGTRQIQVVIPHAEAAEVARIERVISESGALTFRILASRAYLQDAEIIKRGESEAGSEILTASGQPLARWVPVFESEKEGFASADMVTRTRGDSLEVLVLFNDGYNLTGDDLVYVGRGIGKNGRPGVSFRFNAFGANKCGYLTGENRPDPVQSRLVRNLGIVLNGSLYSAPNINDKITDSGIIEFNEKHTEAERAKLDKDIDSLISILDSGALPAELSKEPVGRLLVGATLGNDTIQKAKYALITAALATIVFMALYYRLAGLIACFCVITNTALIVAVMLALRAAFTLPGLAGLVLTIGMAVDANILIYERIREELQGGASLKMAIRNGYAKAFSAIFDSNITTILVGIILYWIGTEQVKGFAVTLVLGIALNMFTAIFCAKVIMDVLVAQRWVKTFNMVQWFRRPNINFLRYGNSFMTFSAVLILIGLVAVIGRGRNLFDIDFVGGVSVEAVFKESQDSTQIRKLLFAKDETIQGEENRLNDLSVQNVQLALDDEGQKVAEDTHFIITTSIPQVKDKVVLPDDYLNTVRNILKDTFGDKLEYEKFDYSVEKTQKVAEYDETTVTVKRFPKINYDAIKSEIGAAIKKAAESKAISGEFSAPAITRTDFHEGNQTAFEDWTLTFHAPRDKVEQVLASLKSDISGSPNFPTSTTVGGSVARDTRVQGLLAIFASLILITVYIAVRFHRFSYGIVAIIGLFHDVFIVLGIIALSRWIQIPALQIEEFRIGLPVVAAFLTVIGYSINDTIVLFDRIRENLGKSPTLTGSMINLAINQTLSRTVLTSLTTFLTAIVLYIFGGQGIHTFAFAIALGVFFGTYSTIAICSVLLFWTVGVDDTKSGVKEREGVVLKSVKER